MKKWTITIVILGAYVVFSMVYFALNGFNPIVLQKQIQLSARTSFLLFAVTFSAYPLYKIWELNSTKWLLLNRKYFGVSFALIHFYHLVLLLFKNNLFEPVFSEVSLPTLFIGIITYTFIGLMLLTSFPVLSKKLSEKEWPRLHTVGGYVILTVFTYFYSLHTYTDILYLPLLLIALVVWTLRLFFNKLNRI